MSLDVKKLDSLPACVRGVQEGLCIMIRQDDICNLFSTSFLSTHSYVDTDEKHVEFEK